MKNNRVKAIIFLVLAAVLWSSGGILIKLVDWNPVAIAGTRSGIAALVMMAYLRKPVKVKKEKTIGALFYCATVILFVIANKMTTAANTILLQYSAPVWVALMSGWILKEKVRKLDWAAIGAVMVGMVLFFVGDLEVGQMMGNVVAVFAGITLAGVVVCLKLVKDGTPVEVPLMGNVITFLVALPFILGSMPDMKSIVGLILLGVFQLGISYILFAEASKYVSAVEAILIPVIEPLLNPIWVFMFAGEAPGPFAVLGGLVVITAVVLRSLMVARVDAKKQSISQDIAL
tara:strand:- start:164 stop:1027 length:864 start_codon:yes stop_codon:yes gene_type:complete